MLKGHPKPATLQITLNPLSISLSPYQSLRRFLYARMRKHIHRLNYINGVF